MARKFQSTTVRYRATRDFDYVSAGREYDVTVRSNSKSADFRRTDGSGIGTYVQMWQFKRAVADGSVVAVSA
jgi:hypothetical protein